MFSNKPKVAQHHNCKQNADVAYYGLYDVNKIQNYNLYSISFHKIYTLLGLPLMVCTQFDLERKGQFSFRDTLNSNLTAVVKNQFYLVGCTCTVQNSMYTIFLYWGLNNAATN